MKYLILVLLFMVGCTWNGDLVHIGTRTDTNQKQENKIEQPESSVTIIQTPKNEGGDSKMDLAFYGIYGSIWTHILFLFGLALIVIGLTQYLSSFLPLPKALFSFLVSGVLIGLRLLVGLVWKKITGPGGELILDAIFSAVIANWIYAHLFKMKLFKR